MDLKFQFFYMKCQIQSFQEKKQEHLLVFWQAMKIVRCLKKKKGKKEGLEEKEKKKNVPRKKK